MEEFVGSRGDVAAYEAKDGIEDDYDGAKGAAVGGGEEA